MAEHTKGPWGTLPTGPWELDHPDANWFTWCGIGPIGGDPVAIVMSERDDCDASADRIVACVNALEGYNPDAVRDVVEAAKRIQAECKIFASWVYSQDIGNEVYGKIEEFDKALSALEGGAS